MRVFRYPSVKSTEYAGVSMPRWSWAWLSRLKVLAALSDIGISTRGFLARQHRSGSAGGSQLRVILTTRSAGVRLPTADCVDRRESLGP